MSQIRMHPVNNAMVIMVVPRTHRVSAFVDRILGFGRLSVIMSVFML